jgi:hypothetical protein
MVISRRSVALSKLALLALVAAALSSPGMPLGVLVSAPAYAQARKPKPSPWAGSYSTGSGDVEIRPNDGESFDVAISGSDPHGGSWTCELEGEGRLQADGTLLVEEQNGTGDPPARIRLSLKGDRLTVKDVTAPEPQRSYCGLNGSIDGEYRRKTAPNRKAR